MKQYTIDANGLISFVTDRNPGQREIVSRYFVAAANLEQEIVLVVNVITEFVYVLSRVYKISDEDINSMLGAMIETPGIAVEAAYDLETILRLWPEEIGDYGDAVVASFAIKKKIPAVTFDKNLKKLLKKHHLCAI